LLWRCAGVHGKAFDVVEETWGWRIVVTFMEEVGVNGRERDREENDGGTWRCAGGGRHGG